MWKAVVLPEESQDSGATEIMILYLPFIADKTEVQKGGHMHVNNEVDIEASSLTSCFHYITCLLRGTEI